MAKRPQKRSGSVVAPGMPTTSLDVTSSPVNTFVPQGYAGAPAPPPGATPPPQPDMQPARDLMALSRSFEGLSNSLGRLGVAQAMGDVKREESGYESFEAYEITSTDASAAEMESVQQSFARAVDAGVIPANVSPAFRKGWSRAAAGSSVREFALNFDGNQPGFMDTDAANSPDATMGLWDGGIQHLIQNPPQGIDPGVWQRSVVAEQSVPRRRFEASYSKQIAKKQYNTILQDDSANVIDIAQFAMGLEADTAAVPTHWMGPNGMPILRIEATETAEELSARQLGYAVDRIHEYLKGDPDSVLSFSKRNEVVFDALMNVAMNTGEMSRFAEDLLLSIKSGPPGEESPLVSGARNEFYVLNKDRIDRTQREWNRRQDTEAIIEGLVKAWSDKAPNKRDQQHAITQGMSAQDVEQAVQRSGEIRFAGALNRIHESGQTQDPNQLINMAMIESGHVPSAVLDSTQRHTWGNVPTGAALDAYLATGDSEGYGEWIHNGVIVAKGLLLFPELLETAFDDENTREVFTLLAYADDVNLGMGTNLIEMLKKLRPEGANWDAQYGVTRTAVEKVITEKDFTGLEWQDQAKISDKAILLSLLGVPNEQAVDAAYASTTAGRTAFTSSNGEVKGIKINPEFQTVTLATTGYEPGGSLADAVQATGWKVAEDIIENPRMLFPAPIQRAFQRWGLTDDTISQLGYRNVMEAFVDVATPQERKVPLSDAVLMATNALMEGLGSDELYGKIGASTAIRLLPVAEGARFQLDIQNEVLPDTWQAVGEIELSEVIKLASTYSEMKQQEPGFLDTVYDAKESVKDAYIQAGITVLSELVDPNHPLTNSVKAEIEGTINALLGRVK